MMAQDSMTTERERETMSNVISFHPAKYDLINLYEVTDAEGIAQWGGEKPHEAVDWYTRAPIGSRLLVSAWSSDEEDAVLIGQPVDITHIINQAIVKGKGE
jgi:hypothetical protein